MIRAITLGAVGRHGEALTAIAEAQTTLHDGDPMAPDIGLVHAELLMSANPSDPAAAETELVRVETLAAARGCHMAHLRALTLLAQLRRGTAREHETLRALGDVYDRLTEGFELPQLAAARMVLEDRAEQRDPRRLCT